MFSVGVGVDVRLRLVLRMKEAVGTGNDAHLMLNAPGLRLNSRGPIRTRRSGRARASHIPIGKETRMMKYELNDGELDL